MTDEEASLIVHGAGLMMVTAALGPMPWWGFPLYGIGVAIAKFMVPR